MIDKLPHAIREGRLKIGEAELGCAVLDDETRVLTQQTLLKAIGRSGPAGGKAQEASIVGLPVFLAASNLKPFISEDLRRSSNPILFRPRRGGRQTAEGGKGGRGFALGFDARILPEVCRVFLEARDKGQLSKAQLPVAEKCDRLLRGLAVVGIIALIDEATGHQAYRDRDALQKILEAYINPELLPWTKRFPFEFFKQLFRLRGWEFNPNLRGPRYAGKLINKLVYEQLPDGVLEKLKQKNPPNEKGRRGHKLFQDLTLDIGIPHLENQLIADTTLMRAAPNWTVFERLFSRAFPPRHGQLSLDLIEQETQEGTSKT